MPEIQWISRQESERLDTMIGRDFVRRQEKEKGESKDYFWRVMSACPYVPSIATLRKMGMVDRDPAPKDSMVTFYVQKFHRNKFMEKNVTRDGITTGQKVNEPVAWVTLDLETGNSEEVHPEDNRINFSIDSHDFEKEFKPDAFETL